MPAGEGADGAKDELVVVIGMNWLTIVDVCCDLLRMIGEDFVSK